MMIRPWQYLAVLPLLFTLPRILSIRAARRLRIVPPTRERVLVLGASSGIGRAIAHLYAARGARVCVVGRRKEKVEEVVAECTSRSSERESDDASKAGRVFGLAADFANIDDMVRVRTALETEWKGVDTVIVTAGVSALQPLMAIAGVEVTGKIFTPEKASTEAIQHTVDVVNAASTGNYIGPAVAALALIPLLSNTSASPSILLLSSLGAVIAAPTRSVYGSTKSAALLLYQALSIEHPNIAFSLVLPSTVDGDFRASAVDGGPIREADPNKGGLKKEAVAQRCVDAVDRGEKTVFVPGIMKFAHLLYWLMPWLVEYWARRKYRFP